MAVSTDDPVVSPLRRPRAPIFALLAVILVLVIVVALLLIFTVAATVRRPPPTQRPPQQSERSASPTVNDIYQKVGPSVAVVETAKGALGTGVIANTAGAVITANHVIADKSAITIVFADGTKSKATVASSDATD